MFFFLFLQAMLYYGCVLKFNFLGCLNCNDTRGGGGVVVVVFLPIIIPPQEKLFWVVATRVVVPRTTF